MHSLWHGICRDFCVWNSEIMIRNADPTVENSDAGISKKPAPKMGKLSSKIVKTQLKIRKPSSKSGKTQFLRLLLSVRNRVRCTKDKPALIKCLWWYALIFWMSYRKKKFPNAWNCQICNQIAMSIYTSNQSSVQNFGIDFVWSRYW